VGSIKLKGANPIELALFDFSFFDPNFIFFIYFLIIIDF